MSHSPATPDKSTVDAAIVPSKVPVPSLDKLTSTSKVKQASFHEPSPASTYGDTAAGDSFPATPQEAGEHDSTMSLMQQLQAAQISDPNYPASRSPNAARQVKYYTKSERHGDITRGNLVEPYSSPSKTGSVGNFHFSNASAGSSPTADRYKHIIQSPSWRRKEEFVRQSRVQSEDPFVSRSGSNQAMGDTFLPRQDREGLELSGDNAQAVLPPNACVFVANLSSMRSDEQLEFSVSRAFQAFGNVYVKIRRDNKGMPFAFCQYEHVSDSERAITLGRGLLVDGRPCRTERAKVNRSLYLSKVTGGSITEDEARHVLTPYGAIEKVWYCTPTDKEMFRLPEGIWAMFAFFQDCRDAQAAFRDKPNYRLEQPKMPEDIRSRLGNRPFSQSPVTRSSPGYGFVSPQTLMRRAADRCSVFVGNLPPITNEDQLRDIFGGCGRIRHVEIVRKPSVNINGVNAFAFIEFSNEGEVSFALEYERSIEGVRLRVERKESAEPVGRRGSPMTSMGSPRNRYVADPVEASLLFQHGFSVGMANAAVSSPIFNPNAPQGMPPPIFAPYSYYQPPYNSSQYGPYVAPASAVDEDTSAAMQVHNSTYMTQPIGQFQYPQGTTPYAPYSYYPPRPSYVYPPNNSNSESAAPVVANANGE